MLDANGQYGFNTYFALTRGADVGRMAFMDKDNEKTAVNVGMTVAERERIRKAAKRASLPLATFIRIKALEASNE